MRRWRLNLWARRFGAGVLLAVLAVVEIWANSRPFTAPISPGKPVPLAGPLEPEPRRVVAGRVSVGRCVLPPLGEENALSNTALAVGPLSAKFEHRAIGFDLSPNNPKRSVMATSGNPTNTARLWDVQSGRSLLTLSGHTGFVSSATFSRDGALIATASQDGTARLWDRATGRTTAVLRSLDGPVFGAVFSPDGTRVATWGPDGTILLWDARSGEQLLTLKGHSDQVTSLAFTADGRRMVSGSVDTKVIVWDTESGAAEMRLKAAWQPVLGVAVSNDGRMIATVIRGTNVRIWNFVTGDLQAEIKGTAAAYTLAFSPEGDRLVTTEIGALKTWDVRTGRLLATMTGHTMAPFALAFSANGGQIVTGSLDETVRVWSPATGDLVGTFDGPRNWVRIASASPDGTRVAIGFDQRSPFLAKHAIRLLGGAAPGQRFDVQLDGGAAWYLAFSPDGSRFATSEQGTISVRDAVSGAVTGRIDAENGRASQPAGQLLFDQAGGQIAFVAGPAVQVSDTRTGVLRHKLTVQLRKEYPILRQSQPVFLSGGGTAFSPDGRFLMSGTDLAGPVLWDLAADGAPKRFDGSDHMYPVTVAGFSGNGARVTAGNPARVWNTTTGELVGKLGGASSSERTAWRPGVLARAVAMDESGRRLLTLTDDGARLWSEDDGWQTAAIVETGPDEIVGGVAWSVHFEPLVVTCRLVPMAAGGVP